MGSYLLKRNGKCQPPVQQRKSEADDRAAENKIRLSAGLSDRWRPGGICACTLCDQGLNKIPDGVTDRQTLLVGDVLATGYWAARISEISEQDTVLIIGIGPPVSVPCFR